MKRGTLGSVSKQFLLDPLLTALKLRGQALQASTLGVTAHLIRASSRRNCVFPVFAFEWVAQYVINEKETLSLAHCK